MNVGVGPIRLKFRGLAELPSFTDYEAVLLPFDTYHAWMGEAGEECDDLAGLQLRARLEVLRAASGGTTVGFIYEDCFAHYRDQDELGRRSLGAMVLSSLGLEPAPLPGPDDRLEVLAPSLQQYLRRFGIAESYLETRHPEPCLRPLCRTAARQLTGVASPEGEGSIVFLPGDPRNRFLEFFTVLGEGLQSFRGEKRADHRYLFAKERLLLQSREKALHRLVRIDRHLDSFRRRRKLLALAEADMDRLLPEWFDTFLDVELRPCGEPGVFHLLSPAGDQVVLLSGSTGRAGDSLVAVKEIRDEQVSSGLLPPGSKAVLYQAVENPEQEEEQDGKMSFDLEAEASREEILILRPVDLLRLLDRSDRGEEGSLFALLAGTAGR